MIFDAILEKRLWSRATKLNSLGIEPQNKGTNQPYFWAIYEIFVEDGNTAFTSRMYERWVVWENSVALSFNGTQSWCYHEFRLEFSKCYTCLWCWWAVRWDVRDLLLMYLSDYCCVCERSTWLECLWVISRRHSFLTHVFSFSSIEMWRIRLTTSWSLDLVPFQMSCWNIWRLFSNVR